jgi:hypothetical protein
MRATVDSFKKAFKHKLPPRPTYLQDEIKKLLREARTRLDLIEKELGVTRDSKRKSEKVAELEKMIAPTKEFADKLRDDPAKLSKQLEKARDEAHDILKSLQPEAAKLIALRREKLLGELATLEKAPDSRANTVDLQFAKNMVGWAGDEARAGDFSQALISLDEAAGMITEIRDKDKSGQKPPTAKELSEQETAWKANRLCLVDLVTAAEQSLLLLVEVFGASDVAKKRGKDVESLKKNLAGLDEVAKKNKRRATRIAERYIKDADALVKEMQPDAETIYQQRRVPVQAAYVKLLKHPQIDMLKDVSQTVGATIKAADRLAKIAKYKFALQQLASAYELATSANSVDLSKPEKKAIYEEIKKSGDPAKALAVAAVTTAKGSADKDDAVAVAKETAKLPTEVLRRLKAKGAEVVAARGNVPDVIKSLSGVHPNFWPEGMTWDNVPGVYDPNSNQIVAATRQDGKGRKVLEAGKKIKVKGNVVSHGSFSVVLHEAGHGLDFNGFNDGKQEIKPELSSDALFTSRRNKDVTGKKIKAPRDNYFLQGTPWGERETFAESTARYFGGDGKFAGDDGWPETAKFWQAKPWGIGSV